MFRRKNKARKHFCKYCGHINFNIYYGNKSYSEMPIVTDDMEVLDSSCARCGEPYYYTIVKE